MTYEDHQSTTERNEMSAKNDAIELLRELDDYLFDMVHDLEKARGTRQDLMSKMQQIKEADGSAEGNGSASPHKIHTLKVTADDGFIAYEIMVTGDIIKAQYANVADSVDESVAEGAVSPSGMDTFLFTGELRRVKVKRFRNHRMGEIVLHVDDQKLSQDQLDTLLGKDDAPPDDDNNDESDGESGGATESGIITTAHPEDAENDWRYSDLGRTVQGLKRTGDGWKKSDSVDIRLPTPLEARAIRAAWTYVIRFVNEQLMEEWGPAKRMDPNQVPIQEAAWMVVPEAAFLDDSKTQVLGGYYNPISHALVVAKYKDMAWAVVHEGAHYAVKRAGLDRTHGSPVHQSVDAMTPYQHAARSHTAAILQGEPLRSLTSDILLYHGRYTAVTTSRNVQVNGQSVFGVVLWSAV